MSRQFDVSENLTVASPSWLSDQSGTFACWFKANSLTAAQLTMMWPDGGNASDVFAFRLRTDLSNRIVVASGSPSFALQTGIDTIADTNWHHVALMSNGSITICFVDGAVSTLTAAVGSNTGQWFGDCTLTQFVLGGYDVATGVGNDHELADCAYWSGVALTDGEVASLAAGFSPLLIRPSSLASHWQLPDNNNSDPVGGYDLTPTGTLANGNHPPIIYPTEPVFVNANPPAPAATRKRTKRLLMGVG